MAVSVTLTITPSAPQHGDTITATYTVTGNNPIPVSGDVKVGGVDYAVSASVTPSVVYTTPTAPGLTFTATSTPGVYTAVAP